VTAPAQGRTDGRAVRLGLPDQIVGELLRAVADGSYPPGSRLPPEAELAARARVSRLTLREAVKVLRDKGVLRVEQGRGTFVNPPAAWSALDADLLASRTALSGGLLTPQIVEARRVVEVGIAGLAAARRTDEDLASMRAVVDTMRTTHAEGDVEAFSVADSAFHETVLHAAGNPFLTALFEPIRTLVHQVRVSTSHLPLSRELAIAAHTRILEAVEAQDEEEARRAVSDHLDETHRTALDGSAAVRDASDGPEHP
jgi:DNA-binding FadR family transcriptional regulator